MYTYLMKTTIRMWGNSLAIRIPKAFAVNIGIDSGKEVELSLESNSLRITPRKLDLHALLEQVTPETLHGEVQTGSAVGREVW
jgi:antitoxin MazE